MSKSYRLVQIAQVCLLPGPLETEILDLSRLSSEYGCNIQSVQSMLLDFASALPLAVLVLPNYSLGQSTIG